ncbi:hypothetical protein SLS63_011067 [Diaporthe eres]|uniref:Uncharacterized protein n=1 Tax=Diaporthe eres TaxID=83184 RepID=A0ABR1NV13_DIAER
MRPGVLQSTADFLSQQLAKLSADLARQPLILKVFLVACAVAILGLALFLACARRRLEKQLRLHECRRHFYDDGDDDGFAVCEKVLGPVRGEGSWPETHREFGLKAGMSREIKSWTEYKYSHILPDIFGPAIHCQIIIAQRARIHQAKNA